MLEERSGSQKAAFPSPQSVSRRQGGSLQVWLDLRPPGYWILTPGFSPHGRPGLNDPRSPPSRGRGKAASRNGLLFALSGTRGFKPPVDLLKGDILNVRRHSPAMSEGIGKRAVAVSPRLIG
jgi:hypothetical protein